MTNNKLTDNKIIKALECCAKSSWLNDCDDCPCFDPKEDIQTSECQERLMKYALDLINHLQAQNKDLSETVHNLTIEKDALFDKLEELKAGAEKLEKENQDKERAYNDEFCLRKEWQTKCQKLLKDKQTAKAEAVKEFAEKLKEYATQGFWETDAYVGAEQIDNLVKEFEKKENTIYDN